MTDEQRAREVACDALVACCKLPSDTPVDQYHHEPECDALTAAILQAGRYTKAQADARCKVRDPNPDNPPEVAVLAPEVAQALTAKDARIAELEAENEKLRTALDAARNLPGWVPGAFRNNVYEEGTRNDLRKFLVAWWGWADKVRAADMLNEPDSTMSELARLGQEMQPEMYEVAPEGGE